MGEKDTLGRRLFKICLKIPDLRQWYEERVQNNRFFCVQNIPLNRYFICLTFGLHQGQGFKLACYESFLQIPVRGGESDITHVSHHYVLHTDIIFPSGK